MINLAKVQTVTLHVELPTVYNARLEYFNAQNVNQDMEKKMLEHVQNAKILIALSVEHQDKHVLNVQQVIILIQ